MYGLCQKLQFPGKVSKSESDSSYYDEKCSGAGIQGAQRASCGYVNGAMTVTIDKAPPPPMPE